VSKKEALRDKYIFCVSFIAFIYGSALVTKAYLWKNKKEWKSFPLCLKMKRIHPVVLFPFEGEAYLVKGTSIVIYRHTPKGRYTIEVLSKRLYSDDDEEVDVEYILENYPEHISEDFIFNLNIFR